MDDVEVQRTVEQLERVLASVDAGELDASAEVRAGLVGALAALRALQHPTV